MIDAYLPEIFLCLMGLSILIYAVLDGYDLGVGMTMPMANEAHRDKMIASIGPFWDANETWLVLAIGILLIAFPFAQSIIFTALYFPTFLMLVGLILRGVSFDFRAKAKDHHKYRWDLLFKAGSWLTALTQGYMLGRYVMGFEAGFGPQFFALLSALCVSAAYSYIGSAWLVMKATGALQKQAAKIGRRAGWMATLGMLSISIANPLISDVVFERWFSLPALFLLATIPFMCIVLIISVDRYLAHVPTYKDIGCWFPFVAVTLVFMLNFLALAYSFYPQIIPGVMSAQEAASATASLKVIFYGVAVVLPFILLYTALAYRIFWGKTKDLTYS
ncbi:cytochrome d ubiquinol oxidase subunit II [Reinekea marinisedimentorum]|uniref:Cytochrome d ubiquinol oxidase subunit II n=1 Tax=Reinekea marinisedimentorum TaxID=230495 RepID=A0A4R3I4N9_9GAMM|nr:cytochrome d ubiquinol oxidase subunit II [Reinekea marinisedimentorum]TCS40196.1 cytochrome d ubiquinol oxidase subunit II [Reinekea marinisedimentorum]